MLEVFSTKTRSHNFRNVNRFLKIEADRLSIPGFAIKDLIHGSLLENTQPAGIILQAGDKEEYTKSLQILKSWIIPMEVPYLYVVSGPIQIDLSEFQEWPPYQFLIEPMSFDVFQKALNGFLVEIQKEDLSDISVRRPYPNKIWVEIKPEVYHSIEVDNILYVEAEDHYVRMVTESKEFPSFRISLAEFYKKHLRRYSQFMMLSKSYLVNTNKIEKIESNSIILGNSTLNLSRSKKNEVMAIVGL